ncbi:MAG: 50S ribosomal protein L18 [Candidatus Pacearchaeota archaeon]
MKKLKLDKKRRLQNKTNYKKRLILLKGEHPRLVARKTNRYIILQIVTSDDAHDIIESAVTTKDLLKHGWPEDKKGSLKSIPAAYLGGYLLGKKSKIKERIILDSGLIPNTKGSKIYAAVKGISDAGIDISYGDVIPDEKRIQGENTKFKDFEKVKSKIGK